MINASTLRVLDAAVVRLQTATALTMAPSPSPAMVTARAEQGTLGALAVPRVTVGKNPFIKSQAGMMILLCSLFFSRRRDCVDDLTWRQACMHARCYNRARAGNTTEHIVGRCLHQAVVSSIASCKNGLPRVRSLVAVHTHAVATMKNKPN